MQQWFIDSYLVGASFCDFFKYCGFFVVRKNFGGGFWRHNHKKEEEEEEFVSFDRVKNHIAAISN